MKIKLKTLKDLDTTGDISDYPKLGTDESKYPQWIDRDYLKQEAIKHAKKLDKDIDICIKSTDTKLAYLPMSQLNWIKYFFNIKDEELE